MIVQWQYVQVYVIPDVILPVPHVPAALLVPPVLLVLGVPDVPDVGVLALMDVLLVLGVAEDALVVVLARVVGVPVTVKEIVMGVPHVLGVGVVMGVRIAVGVDVPVIAPIQVI